MAQTVLDLCWFRIRFCIKENVDSNLLFNSCKKERRRTVVETFPTTGTEPRLSGLKLMLQTTRPLQTTGLLDLVWHSDIWTAWRTLNWEGEVPADPSVWSSFSLWLLASLSAEDGPAGEDVDWSRGAVGSNPAKTTRGRTSFVCVCECAKQQKLKNLKPSNQNQNSETIKTAKTAVVTSRTFPVVDFRPSPISTEFTFAGTKSR